VLRSTSRWSEPSRTQLPLLGGRPSHKGSVGFPIRSKLPSLAGWGALPPPVARLSLAGRALPPLSRSDSPERDGRSSWRSGPSSVSSARILSEPGAHGHLLGTSPARVRSWSVVRAALGASGVVTTVAFCGDSSGGLLGSPRLGFHVCHLCRSDPAPLRSSKLVRRSRCGRTPSKKEDKAMVFNVKEPLGRPSSRLDFPPRPTCPGLRPGARERLFRSTPAVSKVGIINTPNQPM